jgi:hypothetical protein
MAASNTDDRGLNYAAGVVGKHLYRVRETYVADHVAPMITKRQVGAVKLDLVLRGLALLPQHAGERRQPGFVIRNRGRVSYEALHDLCRDPGRFSICRPEDEDDDPEVREKKRTWVGEQLQILEARNLLRREAGPPGGRPDIYVLSDIGNGDPFDDPGADATKPGNSYVTILGPVIASDHFRDWGAPQIVGYLCAMVADRHARHTMATSGDPAPSAAPGGATWFRQAAWFNNDNGYRYPGHVVLPFATKTIERGLVSLAESGLISARWSTRHPFKGTRLKTRRKIYTNNFDTVGATAEVIDIRTIARSA